MKTSYERAINIQYNLICNIIFHPNVIYDKIESRLNIYKLLLQTNIYRLLLQTNQEEKLKRKKILKRSYKKYDTAETLI